MKSTLKPTLMFFGGLVMLSSSAMAANVTCQSVLAVSGDFQALETVGACDVGNVLFSGFNTSLNPTSLLVSSDGGVSTGLYNLLGLSYTYLGGSLPAGTIGWTATFDPTAGVGCPVGYSSCGIDSLEGQLLGLAGSTNLAVINVAYSGGFTGSGSVNALTTGGETYQVLIPQTSSVTKLATYNGLGNISSYETDVNVGGTSSTPEPATFGILGVALMGLAFAGRKHVGRK